MINVNKQRILHGQRKSRQNNKRLKDPFSEEGTTKKDTNKIGLLMLVSNVK